jgi:hypothetical protein
MVRGGGWGLIFSEQQEPVGGKNVCSLENLIVLIVWGGEGEGGGGRGDGGRDVILSVNILLVGERWVTTLSFPHPPTHKINDN